VTVRRREAKVALKRILVAPVTCERKYLDRHQRTVAHCLSDGRDIAAELVLQGHAVG